MNKILLNSIKWKQEIQSLKLISNYFGLCSNEQLTEM